ncbi:type 11 methyltransferase [Brachyspira suanatina]|uniref:Type 11 methyltransferase n=1 Tax=Brachyspira suanatina TaxID=381802 RepID=A0A0G4KB59_9SPIR|nr:class I SAM-dependent methyltransferase [Brachyspira suanatina]CRF35760.1 type 11 methyltransferase [Brachyspira suanatina]
MPRNIIDKLAWWIPNKGKRKKFRYDINKAVIEYLVNNPNEFPELYSTLLNIDDKKYLHEDCPISKKVNHSNFTAYLKDTFNKKGMRILEIGSRVVTGYCFRNDFNNAEYIGFDYHNGENVDIVGDAHKLSSYFNKDEQFDLIFSSAVFEHLAMPWKVAEEISKLLKIGGTVFIETHFSFSSHERPWHFFQFSDMALKSLFSPALGFECIEAGFSNPIIGRFSTLSSPYLVNRPVTGLYCHSEYLGKKIRDVKDFNWNDMTVDKIIPNTEYPKPNNV